MPGDVCDLSLHVVHEAFPARPVVQGEAAVVLLLDEERGRFDFGVAEAQVLVQVVQAVQEVSQVLSEDFQDGIVAVFDHVADEGLANPRHQLVSGHPRHLVSGPDHAL